MSTKAIYAGSFDPFTNGHLDVLVQAATIFDEVIVVIASNSDKIRHYDVEKMRDAIKLTLKYRNFNNVEVVITNKLIAQFAKENEAQFLIRGLRNTTDYLQEENLAQANQLINPWIRTVYIRATNSALSSSAIREFLKYNREDLVISNVPETVFNLITRGR